MRHRDVLNANFDGSQDAMDPIHQSLASTSVSDNEVCAISEMKKQEDRRHFEQEMFRKTSSMFDNKVW